MKIFEQIIEFEKNCPMTYLDYKLTSWGRMFCDVDNKESFTSNYAIIDRNENIEEIIKEIEEYYNLKNITPKIFYRHGSLELNVLKSYFEKYDYSIREFDIELMIWDMSYDCNKNKVNKTNIHIVGHPLNGQEYELAIEQDDGDIYGIKQLNKQISAGNNNMFFSYDENRNPVSMALAENYNNTIYISNVYTTPSMRHKGYGMAVVNAIISYYKDSLIYLHTHNPEAASIYRQLSFSSETFKSWWAVKGSLPEWCK
jgi:GNAT superfamily N-acetyltransferase